MKRVYEVLKELNTQDYELEIYTQSGGLIGVIDNAKAENDMGLTLTQMRVRDGQYEFNPRKCVARIKIHEQDNMAFIELLYRIIAKWKRLIWEENAL